MKPEQENYFDILRQLERLSQEVNYLADKRGGAVFKRYPITFAMLVLFGVIMVTEAAKEILRSLGAFEGSPWITLIVGLIVLVFTGSLYKKLSK